MNRITKMVPAAIGISGLALASLAAVGSAPASAAATCQLTVHSNKVLNLEEDNGTDSIFFKLGNNRTPTLNYALGDKQVNIGSETFQGSIDLKVFEKNGNQRTLVDRLNNIPCQNSPVQVDDATDGDAIYRVRWSVQ
ncbi:MAG TPA: hypothetical protein VH419_06710 [Nocardioidaceae bacterium]|jgi:hypothetical protein